jgi:hypothetical protein
MRVATLRIGLPDFDQGIGQAVAVAVADPTLDADVGAGEAGLGQNRGK